ncbi:hypothetical protein H0O00_05100 [Candidatus Micrarchaeota archaeon]|nr:hypothetical protein [Candidatus Micrarchaeota archaeon]
MAGNTLKNMENVWERSRGHYHYPALVKPRAAEIPNGGAAYDFRTRQTLVDESFVGSLCDKSGLKPEACLEGIFVHEIGHYMVFPRTLGTIILAGKMANDFFAKEGEEAIGFILQTYADMCTDTASMCEEQRTGPILNIRRGLQADKKDELNGNVRAVMLAYLTYTATRAPEEKLDSVLKRMTASGTPLLDKELEPFLERMLGIDFLDQDVEKMRQGLFAFGNIVIDMVKKYGGVPGKGGIPGGPGGLSVPGIGGKDVDIKGLIKGATPADIKEALREIAGKVHKGEFDKIKEWLRGKDARLPEMPPVITIGTSSGELPVDQEVVEYYKDLSTHYPLIVTKKILETDSHIRTWSDVKKWRPGDDPSMALPGSSGGMLLPGITKSIKIGEMPVKTTDYKVPHLLVVIDSSGSMPDPKNRKSYAVLGGYCATRSYHIQDAHIGVINFSGDSFYLPYTRELDHALGAISAYQGGGTTVDVEMVRKMLGPEMAELYSHRPERHMGDLRREFMKKEISIGIPDDVFKAESIDVLLFTDGGISNLDEVLTLFEEKAELNRATIVLTHGFAQELIDRMDSRIQVHRIDEPKDIPNIVIREVTRNFAARVEAIK